MVCVISCWRTKHFQRIQTFSKIDLINQFTNVCWRKKHLTTSSGKLSRLTKEQHKKNYVGQLPAVKVAKASNSCTTAFDECTDGVPNVWYVSRSGGMLLLVDLRTGTGLRADAGLLAGAGHTGVCMDSTTSSDSESEVSHIWPPPDELPSSSEAIST